MILFRSSVAALLVLSSATASAAWADDSAKPSPQQMPSERSRPVPQESAPFADFDVKSTDSGDKVQQRLKIGLDKDKSIFLYGDRSTIYPSDRKPGEDYQPNIPLSQPKDSFGIGIGIGGSF